MFYLLAQLTPNPPQPVSPPVHYSAASYLFAYLTIAAVVVVIIVILRSVDKRMAKPGVIITALLLAMLCAPIAIIYLVKTYTDLKAQDKQGVQG
jgi:hypothetical protein